MPPGFTYSFLYGLCNACTGHIVVGEGCLRRHGYFTFCRKPTPLVFFLYLFNPARIWLMECVLLIIFIRESGPRGDWRDMYVIKYYAACGRSPRCIASYFVPENAVPWWINTHSGWLPMVVRIILNIY